LKGICVAGSLGRPTTLIALAIVVVVIGFAAKTQVDPDLWGHVRFGGDIVSARKVLKSDPYSFTSDREWVNHEWLSEVILFGAYDILGQAGLVLLKTMMVLLTLALATGLLTTSATQLVRASPVLLLTCFAMASTVSTIRPQVFSLLLFAVLLRLLKSADGGARWCLALIPLLMVVWVNVHGGWLVGMGALAIWAASSVIASRPTVTDKPVVLGVAGLSLAATLANPYGPGMWRFLWSTVGLSRPDISEWQSVFQGPFDQLLMWLAAACLAGVLLFVHRRSTRLPYVAITAAMILLSCRVGRLTAFLAVCVPLLLQPDVAAPPSTGRDVLAQRANKYFTLVTIAASLPILIVGFMQISRSAACISMDAPRSWGVPDTDTARFVLAGGLAGRMVTFFDWGEYAIWHFFPRLRVSIDGRRETVYSHSVTEAHAQLYAGEAQGLEFLKTLHADYIWLPTSAPVVRILEQQGWVLLFKGPSSVVFGRVAAHARPSHLPASGPRCFPGP
jgi:hypothetical protein